MNNKPYYLKCAQVVTEAGIEYDSYVLIEGGNIKAINKDAMPNIKIVDLGDNILIPGMIDMHIHGREGCDVMDAQLSSIETIARSLAKHGVTGFLATTVTASWQQTLKAFEVIGQATHANMPGAQVLGAYNEGLFFTETHKGAHNEAFFLALTKERVDAIYDASQGTLKVMALAPEFNDSAEIIRYLNSLGVNVMLGHTNATYQQANKALAAGACGGVHIFNGMSGVHHRDPGCAGAVLMSKDALAEVIADGVHLHPAIMEMIYQLKGKDKIALISDCINAGGFSDGKYRLGELDVIVEHGIARTESGSLAGSTLTLEKSVKNIIEMTSVPFFEAVQMASLVPAVHLNMAEKIGSITVGKRANLAVLSPQLTAQATLIDGEVVYCHQDFTPLKQQ